MKLKLQFCLAVVLLFTTSDMINGQVKITEVMSSSGTNGTPDWIEISNYGPTSVDITGWKMDDNSYLFANAVALTGVTTILAGTSAVFIETDAPVTDIAAFKTFWGSSTDNVSIGSYPSAGKAVGLSSSGDGAILFNSTGTEINRVTIPAATTGKSFYWSYKADGTVVDLGVVSAVGTINGTTVNQVTITSVNALANTASPGTAIILPISSKVNIPEYKTWKLVGNKLKFDVLPTTEVEIFALTGYKVAVYEPAIEIYLILPAQPGTSLIPSGCSLKRGMLRWRALFRIRG